MANNMGSISRDEVERFACCVIRRLGLDGWRMEWTIAGGDLCEKNRHIIFISENCVNQYPWQAKERVLHEVAHIFTNDRVHGEGFYSEYTSLLNRFMVKGEIGHG